MEKTSYFAYYAIKCIFHSIFSLMGNNLRKMLSLRQTMAPESKVICMSAKLLLPLYTICHIIMITHTHRHKCKFYYDGKYTWISIILKLTEKTVFLTWLKSIEYDKKNFFPNLNCSLFAMVFYIFKFSVLFRKYLK